MKKEGKEAKSPKQPATTLRKRAEEVSLETAEQSPENIDGQTPAEIQQTLHELRVHQIELDMQNEELRRTQAQLDTQRERYFDLYDLAPVGYMTVGKQGLIIEANLTVATLLGVAKSKLSKALFPRFIIREDQDIYYRHCKELFETGKPQTCELRMVKKNETAFWAHLEATTAQDDKGEAVCLIVMSDITGRKQSEEALRESEKRYRLIAENTADLISILDMNLNFTYVSPATMPLRGFTVEEAMSQTLDQVLTPESMRLGLAIFEEELQREASGTADPARTRILELEEYRKDGSTIWVEVSLSFLRDKDNKPVEILIVSRDITSRKHDEEALKESEARLTRAEKATKMGNWKLMVNTKEFIGSPGAKTIYGVEGDIISFDDARKCTLPEYIDILNKGLTDLITKDITYNLDIKICRPIDGKIIDIHSTAEYDKENNIVYGVIQDITEQKQAAEEKRDLQERLNRAEKMEALGTLAGGVAHDLNNVLGIVVGYSEMIIDEVDETSTLKRPLVNIFNSGQKAAAIVDDLLTLARRGVPVSSILNLNNIINDCQQSPELANLSSHHPAVKIITDLDADLLNITGSSVHLSKSLYNLISNASEAMTKGGILTIKTTNQYLDKPMSGYNEISEGDYVVLSVSDTGEGISEKDLKRIFEPFYTKKIMGRSGTGLGLAVVWGTVADHKGYINVQSEEGKGSTFTLYFPVTREEITDETLAIDVSAYMGNGQSILIVDDVKEQRELATDMLQKLNYNVSTVQSGEEAILYLKDHQPDLIVLDMIMDPGMDGLDTYKSIIKINPRQKTIIVSGFSESDRVKAAKRLGAGAYVRKPYIREKLGLAVKKELESK